MTGPPGWQPAPPERPARPVDVDTGFWLWLAALPVMLTGYIVGALTSPAAGATRAAGAARTSEAAYPLVGAMVLIAVVVCAVVVAFLVLMRSGYRWARTALTGGGVAAVVYAVSGLVDADPRPVTAVISAVTGIVGSVLIAGGMFLLHRRDAQGYFTR